MRNNRTNQTMREINFIKDFTMHAKGSVLAVFGNTKVICTANIDESIPRFLKGKKQGWLTAEYGMLPSATNQRGQREANRGKQSGRTMEIQRLIGRTLRSTIDLTLLGERTITIDCDVIQADGGTRVSAISGASVALHLAIEKLIGKGLLKTNPLKGFIGAVSVGIVGNEIITDLDYKEDSNAQTDMNVVMNEAGEFLEIQGTAEENSFSFEQLNEILSSAKLAIEEIIYKQKQALNLV